MGILREPCDFIRKLPLPKSFTVCELGDQWVTHCDPHVLAAEWYRELGCGRYESIDGNGRGTITADLNKPLKPNPGTFDLVTDFGTGEHVFDQAQVWCTVHALTKPGGFIAFDRPTQGYVNHGFYNTHPDLFRDIAAANAYDIIFLEHAETKRGELVRGVFQRMSRDKFRYPQQGRYRKALRPIT